MSDQDRAPAGSGVPAPVHGKAPGALAIQGMFFLSGMGALVFENVWFYQTGLVVGNSVWSAALVVGAFMFGLALGNGAAVLLARRCGNLVRGYALLEVVAAVSGAAVVLAFPVLPTVFRPLLAPMLGDAAALNAMRLGIAFALMVVPAIALGATLPLLSRPLEAATGSYGYALGRLYGVNTLGAVAGTLLTEFFLVPGMGLRNTGLFAMACNLAAALIALRTARHPLFEGSPSTGPGARVLFTADGKRILAAAFLAGGILLALEVVWFRFLLLFYGSTTLMFAIMLAVVLAGIGLGGLVAATWSRRGWSASGMARLAAACGAAIVVASYAGFDAVLGALAAVHIPLPVHALLICIYLMAPVCVLSGLLFTALGDHLRATIPDATRVTGALTLANTLGAMIGSLLGAFVLLPGYGLEISFFALAVLYGVTAIVIPSPRKTWRRWAPVLAAGLVTAVFPFGEMEKTHYRRAEVVFGGKLVAAREGISETAFYLRHEFMGEPLYHRLVTNSHSMSSTAIQTQRYMRLFAYLPAAFHPRIERALLICFGVGSTASALTDLPDVRAIDLVDVSRNILAMADIAHPDPLRHPLRDPRVSVHVEDGRFFLQQTERRYDLITGEPPPPKNAGVVSLYTSEYFHLLRSRLNPGGLATYWLPADQLLPGEAQAIIGAFCDAFEDCSLWSGVGLQWILMGSNGGIAPVSREQFSRMWKVPATGTGLREIAIDTPEQLVAQFMADAQTLRAVTALVPPLVDNFPQRLYSYYPASGASSLFAGLMNFNGGRERLKSSQWISGILPRSLVAASANDFHRRAMLDAEWHPGLRDPEHNVWNNLAEVIRDTDLVTWPLWLLGSEARKVEIATHHRRNGSADPLVAEQIAIDDLVNRRRPEKGLKRDRFLAMTPKGQIVTIFHHCLAGQRARAQEMIAWIPRDLHRQALYDSFLSWAVTGCGAARQ